MSSLEKETPEFIQAALNNFMRDGYFVTFHKLKKIQVRYNSIYFGQLVHPQD